MTNIYSFFKKKLKSKPKYGFTRAKTIKNIWAQLKVWLVEVPDALSVLAFNTFIQTINSGSFFTVALIKTINA